MRLLVRILGFAGVLAGAGCASSQYPDLDEPLPPGAMKENAAAPVVARPIQAKNAGTLARADVEKVVDEGLGRFLSRVDVEPSVDGGRFVGWSIASLKPPEQWSGVDLRPGDVVTQINGLPIERETQAYDAFQAVRSANALDVAYLRNREPRVLHFAIVGAPSPALPQTAPPAKRTSG